MSHTSSTRMRSFNTSTSIAMSGENTADFAAACAPFISTFLSSTVIFHKDEKSAQESLILLGARSHKYRASSMSPTISNETMYKL